MFYIEVGNGGRVGNNIFRYLVSRLFCILYGAELSEQSNIYYTNFYDNEFINWINYILENNTIPNISQNITLQGFYQHDKIFKKYLDPIINYINEHPNEEIHTYQKEFTFQAKDILGPIPTVEYSYKTVIHLRVEDFLGADMGMHPESIDKVLKECESPYLFIHKPVENEVDLKYVTYFKNRYPDAKFYTEDVLKCYNLMRHSQVLVCSRSTLSWIAALFNTNNITTYMPLNYGTCSHETFQYPNNNTKIYEWRTISKEDILKL